MNNLHLSSINLAIILSLFCFPLSIFGQTEFTFYSSLTNSSIDNTFGELNGRMLFVSDNKLKATDGNAVFDLIDFDGAGYFGPIYTQAFFYNDRFYFSPDLKTLYATDGTVGGSEIIYQVPDLDSYYGYANIESNNHAIYNGELYLLINTKIHRYNESMESPELLANSFESVYDLKVANDQLYFYRGIYDDHQYFVGDGTVAGSTLVFADYHSFLNTCRFNALDDFDNEYVVYPFSECSIVNRLFINETEVSTDYSGDMFYLNNNLYTVAEVNDNYGIYQFANNNFQLVSSLTGGPYTSRQIGDQILLFETGALGSGNSISSFQNGTTSLIANYQDDRVSVAQAVDGAVYFTLTDSNNTYTLWKTDGTINGTVEIAPVTGPIRSLQEFNGDIYYTGGPYGSADLHLKRISFDSNYNPPLTTLSTPNSTIGGPFTVNVNFSQPVTGFTLDDIDAENFTISNLTGSGQFYSFLVSPGPSGNFQIQVDGGAAQSSNGTANLSSNFLQITADMAVNTFCDAIQVSTGANSISMTPNYAEKTSILIYGVGEVFYSCGTADCPEEIILDNVPSGAYPYTITMWLPDFSESCMLEGTLVVTSDGGGCTDNDGDGICVPDDCNDNDATLPAPVGAACDDFNSNTTNDVIQNDGCSCAGTPIGNGGCTIAATVDGANILLTGMTPDMNLKIFDTSFGVAYECNPWNGNPCGPTATINGLSASTTYYVSVQSDDCDEWIPLTTGSGGGGCTDNDGDGVCQPDDCDDNNPNVPATAGSSCNDNNSNTTNDIIQSDGCTCAGTPIAGGCNITGTVDGTSITISGMTADMNLKLFDQAFGSAYSCNPWNGNPCSGSTTVTGLDANATYYLSVQSDNCDIWLPLTTTSGGGGCTDNDGDGVCQPTDCDDNNPNLPATIGTSCDDGDANTENDVIQADACTCAGTVIPQNGCTLSAAEATNGGIELSGLTAEMNLKVFDTSFGVVFECNPWNGSPCSGTTIVSGLNALDTYFVSVNSDFCNEWIPLTLTNGGNGGVIQNKPDLSPTNLQTPTNALSNQVMDFTFDLNNFGDVTASGDYVIKAYISSDITLDGTDFDAGEIVTGNTGVGTIPGVAGSVSIPNIVGTFFLVLVVDDGDVIAESVENNNRIISSPIFISMNANKLGTTPTVTYQLENIFPNPVHDELFVQLSATTDAAVELRVCALDGRVIRAQHVDLENGINSLSMEMRDLQAGIYFLQVVGELRMETVRFSKVLD